MYKNILLAYDGSEADQNALLACKELANWSSANITLLSVSTNNYHVSMEIVGGFVTQDDLEQDESAQREILDAGVQQLRSGGYTVSGVCLRGDPAFEIAEFAKKNNADLIIVGHKHRTHWAARWWGGARSKELIELSHCSVLIVILDEADQ